MHVLQQPATTIALQGGQTATFLLRQPERLPRNPAYRPTLRSAGISAMLPANGRRDYPNQDYLSVCYSSKTHLRGQNNHSPSF